MSTELKLAVGQYTDKGRKPINQDFHGVYLPKEPQLSAKGVAVALADGISSSDVSHIASQTAVTSFLQDYYCTSDSWTVKTSAERVLSATNSWLHAQTRQSQYRYDKDRGYVCTLSALIIKSNTAHLFHVGDSRIYRLRDGALEQLTRDHRVWVSKEQSYLSRALGIDSQLEIDYLALALEKGDVFLLASDGVYEYVDPRFIVEALTHAVADPDQTARLIVEEAYRRGSADNLTLQLLRIEQLPLQESNEIQQQLAELLFPPVLEARMEFDGYTILRQVHSSHRSHIYLAEDGETAERVILKTPSVDRQDDPAYLERFLLEEWVARRIDSAHVVKASIRTRRRNYLYVVTEFIDGQTLSQWMIDNPRPDLETVRGMVEQIAKGLRAFHRLQMLHQDLRPDNILIDKSGTLKIIDFGSTSVAGIMETDASRSGNEILGTAQYTAPEYFMGESGTPQSDLFSLAVISYQMLTGKLPYGAQVAKSRNRSAQDALRYTSLREIRREIPAWVDEALRKGLHPNPEKRYAELSEYLYDLRHPNQSFLRKTRQPLIERNPLAFWKSVSLILAVLLIVLLQALRTP